MVEKGLFGAWGLRVLVRYCLGGGGRRVEVKRLVCLPVARLPTLRNVPL